MSATLVLGATGASGTAFVRESLIKDASAPLVLYVRSPDKLPEEFKHQSNIKIVTGGLRDDAALGQAMRGVGSVTSFLGAYMSVSNMFLRNKSTPIADSFPHVFDAMRANNVKRIVALSTVSGWPLPQDKLSWKWWLSVTFPDIMVPQGHAEMHKIAEQCSKQTDLDWTAFRVMFLANGASNLPVHSASVLTPNFPGGITTSRGSIAQWVLREIQKPQWIQATPVIGN